jgi:hypothetical protein
VIRVTYFWNFLLEGKGFIVILKSKNPKSKF